MLEQPGRERLGPLTLRYLEPEEHRRLAAGDTDALAQECRDQGVSLSPIDGPRTLDVLLVVPRHDRRTLHELLRCGADRRPELFQRSDQVGVGGGEAGAVSGHRRALAQRVEDRNVSAVAHLERGVGRIGEPELRVGLVGREQEPVLAREICESLEKLERRDRSGRVVRIVDPDNGRSVPGRGVDRVEIGQEAVLLAQRKLEDIGSGEGGSPVGHRVARFRRDDETPVAVAVDEHLREQEDRFLRPVGRDDFRVRIKLDTEAPPAPACD